MKNFISKNSRYLIFLAYCLSLIIEIFMASFISMKRPELMIFLVLGFLYMMMRALSYTYNETMLNYLISVNVTRKDLLKGFFDIFIPFILIQIGWSLLLSLLVPNMALLYLKVLFILTLIIPIMLASLQKGVITQILPVLIALTYTIHPLLYLIVSIMMNIYCYKKLQDHLLKGSLV